MREDHASFEALGARIVVVTQHSEADMRAYWQKHHLPFVGVSDVAGRAAATYGQQRKLLKLGRLPAQFVVDQKGKVAFAHYGKSMADIPKNSAMLQLLEQSARPSV